MNYSEGHLVKLDVRKKPRHFQTKCGASHSRLFWILQHYDMSVNKLVSNDD